MKLSYSGTIKTPVEFAYKYASDFDRLEQNGFGSMAPFKPVGDVRAPELGARWKSAVDFQGKPRRFSLELRELVENDRIVLGNASEKFDVDATYRFAPDGEGTKFDFELTAEAKTITSRLIMQTLQLARARIESAITADFKKMTADIEAEYINSQPA